jgi:hypothetical protein
MIFVATLPHPRSPQMQRTTFVCYGCNQTRSYSLSTPMAEAHKQAAAAAADHAAIPADKPAAIPAE